MTKRVHVVLEDDEYQAIKAAAEARRITVAEWVLQAVRRHKVNPPKTVEEKLRAIKWASQLNHPTADIDVMLQEIEVGRNARGLR
ncbi:MAG: hypothetical protein OXE50_11680 [Chloroflexi bacterium]|nr:hypothetical protein [Chloroflexota bacterium]